MPKHRSPQHRTRSPTRRTRSPTRHTAQDRVKIEARQLQQRGLVCCIVTAAVILVVYLVVKISKVNESHQNRVPERWQNELVMMVERHVIAKTKAAQKMPRTDPRRESHLKEAIFSLEVVERLGGFPVVEARRGYNMVQLRKYIETKLYPEGDITT